MSTRTLTIFSVCLLVTTTRAEIRVELIPDNPGPYSGGELLNVDVWLHSEIPDDVRLVGMRFDFEASDESLQVGPLFTFDFTLLDPAPNYYVTVPELPRPSVYNSILCYCPTYFLPLPAGQSFHAGRVPVRLPSITGVYRLDSLNAADADPEHGGLIYFDYAPYGGNLRASRGEISDGVLDFIVTALPIPTLSTWGSLICGAMLLVVGSIAIRYRLNRTPNGRNVVICEASPMSKNPIVQIIAYCCVAGLIGSAYAQDAEVPADIVTLNIDSGVVSAQGSGSEPVVLFATTVSINDAPWTRLHFAEATLSGSSASSNASFLRVTSLLDGSAQVLNASALGDWGYTSAYMRGAEVRLELLAYRNTGNNRVRVDQASYGMPVEGGIASSPCGDVDERVPWIDARTARFLFHSIGDRCRFITGCSAFLLTDNQNCFLTAGHCCVHVDFGATCAFRPVVEFNVPLSQSNGTITPARPEDQYPLDRYSI